MKRTEKHTFVICAYKESEYIEECIQSLKRQTIETKIILSTATPSEYLRDICQKYQLEYCVRDGKPSIGVDWNYAISLIATPYVTIAHQDDIYEPEYASKILEAIELQAQKGIKSLIAFSDYAELVNGVKHPDRRNLKIKRIMLYGLKNMNHQEKRFHKRNAIRLGNAICCPAVTYHKEYIMELLREEGREALFESNFRSNLDWEAWEWLSQKPGAFIYMPEILMSHRIHEASETTATIQENKRSVEDYSMFCKFWPRWIASILVGQYIKSEETNRV